ncbi:protein IQ-DOMAIN 32-like [Hibiscus syriacus]|uniref:protein IQ-DOMAIN 32-like n=1 Tax=Hibiscus syriacus TaxID=106335 RepID=UPI001921CA84|nr:protein IQ-DOMAIN 32-like [Hibiscus syriacus]
MRKSTSCFKIITCGGDTAETDDVVHVPQAESKTTNDKKGWSFRKRSDRHQVLSNTVIQEATSGLEQSPEFAGFNFQQPDASIAPEKTSSIQYSEEKHQVKTQNEYIEVESKSVAPNKCTEEKSQLLTPMAYTEEKSQLLTEEDCKMPESVPITTSEAEDDANLDESVVIIMQTAVRE